MDVPNDQIVSFKGRIAFYKCYPHTKYIQNETNFNVILHMKYIKPGVKGTLLLIIQLPN
jgi:hypothetical protein